MIGADELRVLDETVEEALRTGDEHLLNVIGYGEISVVLGWPTDRPRVVCKRLPAFPDRESVNRFESTFYRYLGILATRGVDVIESRLATVERPDGVGVYCVQPVIDTEQLAPTVLRATTDESEGSGLVDGVVDHIFAVSGDGTFFDGQLSNWALPDGELVYLDVTTPLLVNADGQEEVDIGLLTASLPWLLRKPVKRWVSPDLLARFRNPRTIVLDLAANLIKERLDRWIPAVLESANPRLVEPLSSEEVRADYDSDARTWAALQRLRRIDRAWQRGLRRRPYEFLLPGPISR